MRYRSKKEKDANAVRMKRKYQSSPEFRDKANSYLRKRKAKRRRWLDFWKLHKGCFVCGYSEYAVALDFHHHDVESKSFEIAEGLQSNLKRLMGEVRKCLVVCSNCHRVLHMKEKESGL